MSSVPADKKNASYTLQCAFRNLSDAHGFSNVIRYTNLKLYQLHEPDHDYYQSVGLLDIQVCNN
jgi:hypothetical protein